MVAWLSSSVLVSIRYDTTEEFNVDSKAEYLAHVARKKETKTNRSQCPFNTVQVKIYEGSPEVTMEERIVALCWVRLVLGWVPVCGR